VTMRTLIEVCDPYEQTKRYIIEDEFGEHDTGWGYFPYPPSEWVHSWPMNRILCELP
jgi:hypothetical protein